MGPPTLQDSLVALHAARCTLDAARLMAASRGGAVVIGPSGELDFSLAVHTALALLHDEDS
jgi:hypothetical protein